MASDVLDYTKIIMPPRNMQWSCTIVFMVAISIFGPALADVENASKHIARSGSVVNYTDPNITVSYASRIDTNMKGMAPLYNLTTVVMDFIQSKDAYPEDYITVRGDYVELKPLSESWKELLKHYAGILILVIAIVIYGVFMWIFGLFFCCCRCAGACGATSQSYDKRHDKCKKVFLGLLLIGFVTLFMFGVVCVFVTNEHINESTYQVPPHIETTVGDVRTFINATSSHLTYLLEKNYAELKAKLSVLIDSIGLKVSYRLADFSKAVLVTTLNNMVKDLPMVRENLGKIQNITKNLRYNAGRLEEGIRKVKNELLQTLNECQHDTCRKLNEKYNIGELKSEINYSSLPNVSELLKNVTKLLNTNIQSEVEEGQKRFNSIKTNIQATVDEQTDVLHSVLADTSEKIHNLSRSITEKSHKLDTEVKKGGEIVYDQSSHYINEYAKYRWQAELGAGLVLLIILFCMSGGLMCGICGKRPDDGYADDCCNKGSGANFLMFGVAVMFLTVAVLSALVLIHVLVGFLTQRAVCDPLQNPGNNRLFNTLDQLIDLEQLLYHESKEDAFNMSYVITSCHRNETVYNVLHLNRLYDVDEFKESIEAQLREKIDEIMDQVSIQNQEYKILSDEARSNLYALSNSGLSEFPFDTITDVLATNLTSIDLRALANQLYVTAQDISNKKDLTDLTEKLRSAAQNLEFYHVNYIKPMLEDTNELNVTASELHEKLRFKHTSFNIAIKYLLDETSYAERYLSTQGAEDTRNLTRESAEDIMNMVDGYLTRVVNTVKGEVGRCAPMSQVYNSTVSHACTHVVMPVNGFWLALGWCLLLFIPLTVLSVKLTTLYRKTDPYPGSLVEAEYMYDAYENRDNIPLANAHAAAIRSEKPHRSRAAVPADRRSTAEPTSVDAHQSRRYNDMAPKHWEEGPPGYHGATEYERPPPYYYPGPSDRQ